MATMDMLIKDIYFEKQQEGSMLCAQHALNSLLQGEYFTAPDLATIAQKLDQLETHYDDNNTGHTSTNMDDTGFFSIQVLEEALKPWGLSLQRWRSEGMLPYHDKPHCQLAFILNSAQHWYTLRRFGEALADFTIDPGVGHWFDLNSSLPHPMWIGKLYLGMTIQHAETAGYSVFAVVQDDPTKPLALPRSEADHISAFVTEDSRPSAAYQSGKSSNAKGTKSAQVVGLEDFDDEEADLQAALQASIMGNAYHAPPSLIPSFGSPSVASGSSTPRTAAPVPARAPFRSVYNGSDLPSLQPSAQDAIIVEDDDDDPVYPPVVPPRDPMADLDPLAASRARNESYMRQVLQEQEEALREAREAEVAQIHAGYRTRGRVRRQEEDDTELRRAIEASRALHQASSATVVEDRHLDEDIEVDDDEGPDYPAVSALHGQDRVYDDDDAELQAALQASLAGAPVGLTIPDSPPLVRQPLITAPAPGRNEMIQAIVQPQHTGDKDTETESETDTSLVEEEPEQLSVEEIRKRRLARFGG